MTNIDLNCDLGEWKTKDGFARDEKIMPFISSCNIACGGHIGDEFSMKKTIELALKHNVAIGAHPSFPDREGFGRRIMPMTSDELTNIIREQLYHFGILLKEMGGQLHHIKPHGALYNAASVDEQIATSILEATEELGLETLIYGQSGSIFEDVISSGNLEFIAEVFSDRAYENDLSLRDRNLEGAVLHSEKEVLEHVYSMVIKGKVKTHPGDFLPIKAETVCLHSDTEGATELAEKICYFLKEHGVEIVAA